MNLLGCGRLLEVDSDVMAQDTAVRVSASVPAGLVHGEIAGLGVTHVPLVPDRHLCTLLALLARDATIRTIAVATEDEAIAVNAGLWIGGAQPLVLMQNAGLLASVNAVRGIALALRVPTCMLIGEFGRESGRPLAPDAPLAAQLTRPVLAALGVATYCIDGPDDVDLLGVAFARSRRDRVPTAVLLGAPTT